MKKMLLIAAAALTLGSATAFADGGDWTAPNAPVLTQQELDQNVAAALAAQRQQTANQPTAGHSYMLYSTSGSQGLSFNPNFGGGGNG